MEQEGNVAVMVRAENAADQAAEIIALLKAYMGMTSDAQGSAALSREIRAWYELLGYCPQSGQKFPSIRRNRLTNGETWCILL